MVLVDAPPPLLVCPSSAPGTLAPSHMTALAIKLLGSYLTGGQLPASSRVALRCGTAGLGSAASAAYDAPFVEPGSRAALSQVG